MNRGNENVQQDDLYGTPSLERVQHLLTFLDPDDLSYNDWIATGMVTKALYPDSGFPVWDEWNQRCVGYNLDEIAAKWDSFTGTGYGVGTLYHLAIRGGYSRE